MKPVDDEPAFDVVVLVREDLEDPELHAARAAVRLRVPRIHRC